jgi:YaiO family outer membrane protein
MKALPHGLLIAMLLLAPAGASLAESSPINTVAITPAQRFAEAQALRQSGDPTRSLALLDALRDEFPFDVDYALGRAQVLAELERDEEALQELRAAAVLAPEYEDVWQLRYRLLGRQESTAARSERAAIRSDAAQRFPESSWWLDEPDNGGNGWTLLVGAGYDDLSNDLPGWNNQFVELQYRQSDSRLFIARLGRDKRYSTADINVGLGLEQSWRSGWFAGAEMSSASSPDYVPELGLRAHVGKSLQNGWVVDVGITRREYATETVNSLFGAIEKYRADWRYAYQLGWSRLQGTSGFFGHQLSANRFYGDASSIGLSISFGDEAEALGSGRVLESDVRGMSINGNHALSERFAIRWWLGTHEQGDFYRRRFVGMAVSIRL